MVWLPWKANFRVDVRIINFLHSIFAEYHMRRIQQDVLNIYAAQKIRDQWNFWQVTIGEMPASIDTTSYLNAWVQAANKKKTTSVWSCTKIWFHFVFVFVDLGQLNSFIRD